MSVWLLRSLVVWKKISLPLWHSDLKARQLLHSSMMWRAFEAKKKKKNRLCPSTKTRSVPFASINGHISRLYDDVLRLLFVSFDEVFLAAWTYSDKTSMKKNTDSIDRLRSRNRKGLNDVGFVLSPLQQIEQRFEDDFKAIGVSVMVDHPSRVRFNSQHIARL